MIKKMFLFSLLLTSSFHSSYAANNIIINEVDRQNSKTLEEAARQYTTKKGYKSRCVSGAKSHTLRNIAVESALEIANKDQLQKTSGTNDTSEGIIKQKINKQLRFIYGSKKIGIVANVSADNAETAAKKIIRNWSRTPHLLTKYERFGFGLVQVDTFSNRKMPKWVGVAIFTKYKNTKAKQTKVAPISTIPTVTPESEIYTAEPESEICLDNSTAEGCKHYDTILVKAVQNYISPENTRPLSADGTMDPEIQVQAFSFAKELAENFYFHKTGKGTKSERLGNDVLSHIGATDRYKEFKGNYKGEILACVTAENAEDAAQQIVQNWYNSPGHKALMMASQDRYSYVLVKTPAIPGFSGSQWFGVALFARD